MKNTLGIESTIKGLREEIIKHDLAYDAGSPIITDTEYDEMYYELVELERKHPGLQTDDSPTKRIYSVVVDGLKRVKHSTPMLSQFKGHTEEDLRKFFDRHEGRFLIQQKLDGLTIVLKYENGQLVQATTRGDGEVGDDVTHTIRNVRNVPANIAFKGSLEVRAEAVIPFVDFERINVDGKYRSPRNLVSGTVRNLSGGVAKDRGVELIVFDLIKAEGKAFESDTEQIEFLNSVGLPMVETFAFSSSEKDKMVEFCLNYATEQRPNLPYMIDGLVLKMDSIATRLELGYTSMYPRWAMAFKFDSLDATTKMDDVVWTVGPSGQLTPNAVLNPVEIDGVLIARASLANIDNVRKRDIQIGDTVIVARANDVIPQVVSSVVELRTGEETLVEIPKNCPECNSEIVVDGWKPLCVSPTCPAQIKRKLEIFVSRAGLNINGLGEKTIDAFYEAGIVRSFTDVYDLKWKVDKVLELPGFAQRGVDKMLKGIEESKKASLSKLLFALSIPNCGEGTSKRMAKSFKTMDNIMSLNEIDLKYALLQVEDIGEDTASTVCAFFMNEENRNTVLTLLAEGLEGKEEIQEIEVSENVTGKKFVVTGALETGSRNDVKKNIESKGGKVSGSVSKSTDYLVMGGYNHHTGEGLNPTSSKSKKAIDLGVEIISEEQLIELLA